MVIQFLLSVFLIFAVSRVLLQLREKRLTAKSFLFWCTVFIVAILGVTNPTLTSKVADIFGIGRGADVVIYFSIVILFYLVFRLTISLEEIRREISKLVREIALNNEKTRRKKT